MNILRSKYTHAFGVYPLWQLHEDLGGKKMVLQWQTQALSMVAKDELDTSREITHAQWEGFCDCLI